MKLLLVTLITISHLSALSQSARQYFDEKGKLLPGPEGVNYYRETTPKGKLYIVKNFYSSSEQLAMEATCSEIEPRLVYEGPYKTYHKDGKMMEDGAYNDNKKIGLWKTYYENGQQEKEVLYEKDKALHQQHWDEFGTAHLMNGSGHYTEKNSIRGEQHIEILDRLLIASYSIDVGGDTTYSIAEETATYNGGMPELYETIGKALRYPADARRRGIEGKVFVEFVIEKDGEIHEVKAIKGPDRILNEEAERVMRMMNDWTSGKVSGKPVRQRMVLPIAFRLG
jgi:periplasmic protein TonB